MVPGLAARVRLWSSLRTEIVLKVIVLILAIVLLLSVVAIKIVEREVLGQRLRSAERIILALHQEVMSSEGQGTPGSSREERDRRVIADRLMRAGNLDSVYLVDRAGQILAHPHAERIARSGDDPLVLRALAAGRLVTSLPEEGFLFSALVAFPMPADVVRIAVPLRMPGGEPVVGVAIVPLGDVKRSLAGALKVLLAFFTLDACVVILFGSWFISRAVVRPLDRLSRAAEAIASGDLGHRVPVDRANEIGLVGRAFNAMAERLKESRDRVEDQVERLERANAELARAQADLLRSEKLASVGRLSAGLAHEIGNPLSAILGLADILLRESPAGPLPVEAREYVEQIRKETERIHGILRRLLDFSRPHRTEIRGVDVNETVRETIRLANPMADLRPVTVRMELDPAASSVRADPALLQQVLLNLVMNAAHAMPDGGTLTIATRSAPFETEETKPGRRAGDPAEHDFRSGRRGPRGTRQGEPGVEIAVADTGCGIPPEHLAAIFDPFFTTKAPGRGTGLGLAVVHGIVEILQGRIRVQSDMGKGTTFRLWLPSGTEAA